MSKPGDLAAATGVTVSQPAVALLLTRGEYVAPSLGARSVQRIEENAGAVSSGEESGALTPADWRSAYALRDRGLLTVDKGGGAARAEITEAGRFYVRHGRHPDDAESADRGEPSAPVESSASYGERPVARARRAKARELVERLLAEGHVRFAHAEDGTHATVLRTPEGPQGPRRALPSSVAKAVRQHMEVFAPVPVTMQWDDPRPAETPVEAKHRRPRTYNLLVTGRERKAINRNYFNSYVWKPALATAGVIAPLDERVTAGARVWEPSREHGFHALRHFYASEELEAGESVVSLARWLGHSDPGFTLRKYSHFLPRAGARGSAAIDAIFA